MGCFAKSPTPSKRGDSDLKSPDSNRKLPKLQPAVDYDNDFGDGNLDIGDVGIDKLVKHELEERRRAAIASGIDPDAPVPLPPVNPPQYEKGRRLEATRATPEAPRVARTPRRGTRGRRPDQRDDLSCQVYPVRTRRAAPRQAQTPATRRAHVRDVPAGMRAVLRRAVLAHGGPERDEPRASQRGVHRQLLRHRRRLGLGAVRLRLDSSGVHRVFFGRSSHRRVVRLRRRRVRHGRRVLAVAAQADRAVDDACRGFRGDSGEGSG